MEITTTNRSKYGEGKINIKDKYEHIEGENKYHNENPFNTLREDKEHDKDEDREHKVTRDKKTKSVG